MHSHPHPHGNGVHTHHHESGHHGDPKVNVLDDTKCVAEGCVNPATKQRTVRITLPGMESGEPRNIDMPPINVPVCDIHYNLLEDIK